MHEIVIVCTLANLVVKAVNHDAVSLFSYVVLLLCYRCMTYYNRWRFDMMPGPGRHFIPYKNKWFWVERERQVNSVTLETGQPWEKVIL
jgi:BCS1 N terminal